MNEVQIKYKKEIEDKIVYKNVDLEQAVKLNSYFILVGYNGESDCELLKVKLYSSKNRLDEIKFNSLNNNDLLRKTTSTAESIDLPFTRTSPPKTSRRKRLSVQRTTSMSTVCGEK